MTLDSRRAFNVARSPLWYSLLLIATRAGSGHRRSLLNQTLVDQQLHLNATILSATLPRIILSHRIRFAISVWRHNASQRHVVIFNQVTNHSIGSALAQHAISL